jgi:hypothetical protein
MGAGDDRARAGPNTRGGACFRRIRHRFADQLAEQAGVAVEGYNHNLALPASHASSIDAGRGCGPVWETGVTAALNMGAHRRPRGSVTMEGL